jgi:hypothetical protein
VGEAGVVVLVDELEDGLIEVLDTGVGDVFVEAGDDDEEEEREQETCADEIEEGTALVGGEAADDGHEVFLL